MLQDKLKTGPLASFVSLKIPFTCTADNFWKSLVVQDSVYYILGDDAIFHVLLRNFTSKVGEPLPGTYPYRTQFQKRLNSFPLIGQKNRFPTTRPRQAILEFVFEVAFLIDRRSSLACTTRRFSWRRFQKRGKERFNEAEVIASCNMGARKQCSVDLSKGCLNF